MTRHAVLRQKNSLRTHCGPKTTDEYNVIGADLLAENSRLRNLKCEEHNGEEVESFFD